MCVCMCIMSQTQLNFNSNLSILLANTKDVSVGHSMFGFRSLLEEKWGIVFSLLEKSTESLPFVVLWHGHTTAIVLGPVSVVFPFHSYG